MHLVLIRHAHRDTYIRSNDNGLSDKGHKQAKSLARIFKERVLPEASPKDLRVKLFSSPKKRCIETLEPIASTKNFDGDLKIEIKKELDEQQDGENDTRFRARVSGFIDSLKKQYKGEDDWILLCSHGDWLPLVLGDVQISKGCWAQMEDGRLVALLQPDELSLI